MNFHGLTFPLVVDFSDDRYWIGACGPFRYGEAATAFLISEDVTETECDRDILKRELEQQLQIFGMHLKPYAKERAVDTELYGEKDSADCSVGLGLHPLEDGSGIVVEQFEFQNLRDFLYVELGKAICCGNAPRQCRLCGQWFLHEHGSTAMYCERIAPGEKSRSCRETGSQTVFEKKIREEDTWRLYKRAYKKYYARVMKGKMGREEFGDWVKLAIKRRDAAILELENADDPEIRADIIGDLRDQLNER